MMSEKIHRLRFLKTTVVATTGTILLTETSRQLYTEGSMQRPQIMGINFSPIQCLYLGLTNIFDTYRRALDLNPDYLRLAAYPTRPDEETHKLLKEAAGRNIKVILAVGGIKYPRWPEFYADSDLQTHLEKTASLVVGEDAFTYQAVMSRLKYNLAEYNKYPNITHLQAGNESANKVAVAGRVTESPGLLIKELETINRAKNPKQKTLTTFSFPLGLLPFAPDSERKILREYMQYVEAVGIHVYSKVPHRFLKYLTAGESDFQRAQVWNEEAIKASKEVWATEVQAEPFENNSAVHTRSRSYPSSNPEMMIDLVGKLARRGYQRQLLWGAEHWLWHQSRGNNEWVEAWSRLQEAPLAEVA